MNFFNQIIQKIFPIHPENEQLEIREPIKRIKSYNDVFLTWKADKGYKVLLNPIAKAYHYRKTNLISKIQIHLFQSTGANGFAVSYDPIFGKKEFQFLFDWWKDTVMTLGYRLQIAERKVKDWKNYVETKEKYYLKPHYHNDVIQNKTSNQLFGNILLELAFVDNEPSYIKILVTYYADAQYRQVKDYDELIQILFDEKN